MAESGWTVEFFIDGKGWIPVREFLDALDPKTVARFLWSIEQLRQRNIRAKEPLVRHLEGDLWELREESRTDIFRLVYVFYRGRRIILLHGFQKKTQRTPRRELEAARRNYATFLEVEGRITR